MLLPHARQSRSACLRIVAPCGRGAESSIQAVSRFAEAPGSAVISQPTVGSCLPLQSSALRLEPDDLAQIPYLGIDRYDRPIDPRSRQWSNHRVRQTRISTRSDMEQPNETVNR